MIGQHFLRVIFSKCIFAFMILICSPLVHAESRLNDGTSADKKSKSSRSGTQQLMQEKLLSAQSLVRDLALEDHIGIIRDGEKLLMIAKAGSWYQTESEDYLRYYHNFREAVQFLVDSAKAKNIEGEAMGYIRVTLSCMQCHNFVRSGRKI
ncbi:MAG: hypothetical protein KBD78_01925 [Oligoflexales bacterium]|nr:hypothetical protein [Oligoflexales bacterium]